MPAPLARTSSGDRHLQWLLGQVRARLDESFPERVALVLAGSLARGEGTVLERGSRFLVLSDVDLALVFSTPADRDRALPRLPGVGRRLGRTLRPWGLLGAVDLGAYARTEWARLEPRPASLELFRSARILSGDPRVVEELRPIEPADIPREEALLLCENRLLELLWAHGALARGTPRAFAAAYAGGKAVLDGGLAWLTSRGVCPATAEERLAEAERILQGAPESAGASELLDALRFWTAFKLAPQEGALRTRYQVADADESCRQAWLEGGRILSSIYRYLLEEAVAVPASPVRAWRQAAGRAPFKRRIRRWLEAWAARKRRGLEWASPAGVVVGALRGTPEHRMGAAAAALVACAPGMNGAPSERRRAERFARAVSPVSWSRRAPWEKRRDSLVRGWDRWVLKGIRSGLEDAPWDDR